jgi:hypothetical protein
MSKIGWHLYQLQVAFMTGNTDSYYISGCISTKANVIVNGSESNPNTH